MSNLRPQSSALSHPTSELPQDPSPGETRKKLWGMLNRRERWGLSFKGRLAVAAFALVTILIVFFCVQPFLAVTQRVDSKILVVEGWVHEFTFEAAVKEFKTGHYTTVFSTGGPVEGLGGYINDFQTSASVGADQLQKLGIPKESLHMVPSRVMARDRTYGAAIALRDWFRENNVSVQNMNVVTEGAHARRTRLLFQQAFGKEVKVGIISVPNPDYDAKHWWRYSEGVREVIDEGIAYVYARFFFQHVSTPETGNGKLP